MSTLGLNSTQPQTPGLPLVRLELLQPFVEELDRRGQDVDRLLQRHRLECNSLQDPNLFVPVNIIHRILEDCARMTADPYFGVAVGEQLDPGNWPPLVDAATQATSLGDFLVRFILSATREATSATHVLEVRGIHAYFREQRIGEPDIVPSQNDAFTAGYVLSILKKATGEHWDSRDVLLQICDPHAVPARYEGVQIVGGDNRGMSVRFPTIWLSLSVDRAGLVASARLSGQRAHPPGSFLDALWLTLEPQVGNNDLSVDYVARLLSLSRQALQRRLKSCDTSLRQEIARIREQLAIEALVRTDQSVAEIGETLGFQSPASFTRAFRAWTGESPREYRKSHKHDVTQ
jgi:AraC-like DNA-binding protein